MVEAPQIEGERVISAEIGPSGSVDALAPNAYRRCIRWVGHKQERNNGGSTEDKLNSCHDNALSSYEMDARPPNPALQTGDAYSRVCPVSQKDLPQSPLVAASDDIAPIANL
jgi:hypothetical protein